MYETLGSLLEEAISGIRVRLRIETFHQVFVAFAMEGGDVPTCRSIEFLRKG
jgi:hypothetical protein